MATDENLPSFLQGEPMPVRKDKTWVWVLVVFVLLCLCLVVLAGGVVVYLYLNRPADATPGIPIVVPTLPAPPTTRPELTAAPPATEAPPPPRTLEIEYYDFSESVDYVDLRDVVADWGGSLSPGTQYWEGRVVYTQPVLVSFGWCTTTPEILDQNFDHIVYTWWADGVEVDMRDIYVTDEFQVDRYCRVFSGLVRLWPLGEHEIIIDMYFDAPLNDGWDDYPAGHYKDVFRITAVR